MTRGQPCMQMYLATAKQRYMANVREESILPPSAPAITHYGGSGVPLGAMFNYNMSHLRGAKPCGSCGGR